MGHGVGGHTDLSHVKIPHYSEYKVSKINTPELYQYQERLAREGLKDPWIRNFVFQFDRTLFYTPWYKKYAGVFLGCAIGSIAFASLVYYDKNYHCPWHHPHKEPYKLLYELKDDGKNDHGHSKKH